MFHLNTLESHTSLHHLHRLHLRLLPSLSSLAPTFMRFYK